MEDHRYRPEWTQAQRDFADRVRAGLASQDHREGGEALEAIATIMDVDGHPGTLPAIRQIVRAALASPAPLSAGRREEPQQAAEAIDDSNIVNISGAPVNPPFQRLPTSATDSGFGSIPEVTGERFVSLGAKDDLPARRRIPNTALSNGTPAASGAPVGSSAKPDEGGSIPQNSSLLESCPFCTMSLAKRSGIGLFWQHPQSDCFFSNQRVTSGQAAAWNRRAASPVQDDVGLRQALEKIRRTPSMPFPDPGAHSRAAWGKAVWLAWREIQNVAQVALSTSASADRAEGEDMTLDAEDGKMLNWSLPLETNDAPPRRVTFLGIAKGGAIPRVRVKIDGYNFHHPEGEYVADMKSGFVRGKLLVRNAPVQQ